MPDTGMTIGLIKALGGGASEAEVEELRSAIETLEPSASASDVGKFLKAKTVSGGKVTEYEFDDPSIDPADVEQAVSDWLTAHPEATTTVQDGSITKAKLSSGLVGELSPVLGSTPTYTEVTGKYISNTGAETSSQYYNRSNPIAISKGDIVSLTATGYSGSVGMICLTNSTGTTFTPVVNSIDSNEHTYTYIATADGYYIVSYKIYNASHTLIQYSKDSVGGIANRFNPIDNLNVPGFCLDADYSVITDNASATMSNTGHYIQSNGTYQSNGSFNISSGILLPADSTIKFNAKGYQDQVAVLAKVDNGVYTPLVISADSNVHTWAYATHDPITVVISTNKDTSPTYSIFTSRIDTIDGRLTDLEQDVFAFATMGVIGDSLASGASNYTGGTADRPNYSWGKYIERVYGVEVSLFSSGGYTTKDWLAEAKGLAALNAADPLDCYVIGLGQNDQYTYGQNYLGTVDDVHVGSEGQNADTYYGNYSKIIAAIKAKSPRAKIFCLTNAREDSTLKANYNTAIKTIVPLYTNTYLVDLTNDPFYASKLFESVWYGSHSTPIGYKLCAKNIHDNICDVMRANISDFLDIQWIVDNHP